MIPRSEARAINRAPWTAAAKTIWHYLVGMSDRERNPDLPSGATVRDAQERFGNQPVVLGGLDVHPAGGVRFPAYEIELDGSTLALLGRYSWFRIFFGRGQPIEIAGGARWRLRAASCGRLVCPVIVDTHDRKVVMGAYADLSYGINGRNYGYMLYGADSRRRRSRKWILREHESDVASLTLQPRRAVISQPIPLAAVLLSFVLMQFGVPGENELKLPPMWH